MYNKNKQYMRKNCKSLGEVFFDWMNNQQSKIIITIPITTNDQLRQKNFDCCDSV